MDTFLHKLSVFLHKLFSHRRTSAKICEDTELDKFYTNCEQELRVFEQLVNAISLPKRLLIIHGLGGMGKSTLLKMYCLSCRINHVPVALVTNEEAPSPVDVLAGWAKDLSDNSILLANFQKTLSEYCSIKAQVEIEARKINQAASMSNVMGKAVTKATIVTALSLIPVVGPIASALGGESSEAFINWLRSFLSKPDLELYLDPRRRLDSAFLSDLALTASKQRIVLMLDTYEQMTALDDWMRELVRRLPGNVLLVIAGRTMPQWNRAWQDWMGKAEIIEVQEMSPDNLRLLINRYYKYIRGGNPDSEQVENIVQFARGLPMVATTVVQLWVQYGLEDFPGVRSRVIADLVDRLLEGVPPKMRPAFEAAAVLRYFNADMFSSMLKDSKAERFYHELRHWPFVRPSREGLAVHNIMREMINEALQISTPERFKLLHKRALAYYEMRLKDAIGDRSERYRLEHLYHLIQIDEEVGVQLFQEIAEELTRYLLINRLRVLLNDVNTYQLNKLNSQLWRNYYNARLAHLEARFLQAEEVYQAIGEHDHAEPKLRAYALCDWGSLLRSSHADKQANVEQAVLVLEQGLTLHRLDSKLVFALTDFSEVYRRLGKRDDALKSLEKAKAFCQEYNDYYGIAYIYIRQKYFHFDRGEWKLGFLAQRRGLEALAELAEPFYLKSQLLGGLGIAWLWTGRFSEGEHNLREALKMMMQVGEQSPSISFLRDLGTLLGAQGKYDEAERAFIECSDLLLRYPEHRAGFGVLWTFWGLTLLKKGELLKAKDYLEQGRNILEDSEKQSKWESFYSLIPIGEFYELGHDWSEADSHYKQWHELSLLFDRPYLECSALTGLVRVKYAQKDYEAIPPFLTGALQLAEQYEYNDHLASLRLIQGHLVWDGNLTNWERGFDSALQFYQQGLLYALHYNRFLLDEVLAGRSQGSHLWPIISNSLEHNEEGKQMLQALHFWWQIGTNTIETSWLDGAVHIPKGIPLEEGERRARRREPGSGSLQLTVKEQLEEGLTMFAN